MQDPKWRDWLTRTTGEYTSRAIAEKIGGTSHTTVQRWIRTGIPPEVVFRLAIRYDADICDTLVALGWVTEEELRGANVTGVLMKVPADALTEELHRRAVNFRQQNPDWHLQQIG